MREQELGGCWLSKLKLGSGTVGERGVCVGIATRGNAGMSVRCS